MVLLILIGSVLIVISPTCPIAVCLLSVCASICCCCCRRKKKTKTKPKPIPRKILKKPAPRPARPTSILKTKSIARKPIIEKDDLTERDLDNTNGHDSSIVALENDAYRKSIEKQDRLPTEPVDFWGSH